MTLVEFLEARIAEDEAIANAAAEEGSDSWSWHPEDLLKKFSDPEGEHVCRFDPARVLRECAAKRALLNTLAGGGGPRELQIWEGYEREVTEIMNYSGGVRRIMLPPKPIDETALFEVIRICKCGNEWGQA